jgi:hypothetical protein
VKPRLRTRRCQYCCHTIGRWAALLGVVNCDDCVFRMQMGSAPRCNVTGRMGLHHEHGEWIT